MVVPFWGCRRSGLLLPHARQEPDEDVDEVQVDGDGRVDGVVHGVGQAHGPVEVEDDQRAEHDESHPVEGRHGTAHGDAEEAEQRHDEVATEQQEQRAEQRSPPGRQVIRDQDADQAEHEHDHRRQGEHLDDRRRLVQGDHGAEHEPERARDEGVAQRGNDRVVAAVGDEHAAEGDEGHDDDEADEAPLAPRVHRPVLADERHDGAEGDTGGGPATHQQHVELSGDGGPVGVVLAIPHGVAEHAVLGHPSPP